MKEIIVIKNEDLYDKNIKEGKLNMELIKECINTAYNVFIDNSKIPYLIINERFLNSNKYIIMMGKDLRGTIIRVNNEFYLLPIVDHLHIANFKFLLEAVEIIVEDSKLTDITLCIPNNEMLIKIVNELDYKPIPMLVPVSKTHIDMIKMSKNLTQNKEYIDTETVIIEVENKHYFKKNHIIKDKFNNDIIYKAFNNKYLIQSIILKNKFMNYDKYIMTENGELIGAIIKNNDLFYIGSEELPNNFINLINGVELIAKFNKLNSIYIHIPIELDISYKHNIVDLGYNYYGVIDEQYVLMYKSLVEESDSDESNNSKENNETSFKSFLDSFEDFVKFMNDKINGGVGLPETLIKMISNIADSHLSNLADELISEKDEDEDKEENNKCNTCSATSCPFRAHSNNEDNCDCKDEEDTESLSLKVLTIIIPEGKLLIGLGLDDEDDEDILERCVNDIKGINQEGNTFISSCFHYEYEVWYTDLDTLDEFLKEENINDKSLNKYLIALLKDIL